MLSPIILVYIYICSLLNCDFRCSDESKKEHHVQKILLIAIASIPQTDGATVVMNAIQTPDEEDDTPEGSSLHFFCLYLSTLTPILEIPLLVDQEVDTTIAVTVMNGDIGTSHSLQSLPHPKRTWRNARLLPHHLRATSSQSRSKRRKKKLKLLANATLHEKRLVEHGPMLFFRMMSRKYGNDCSFCETSCT